LLVSFFVSCNTGNKVVSSFGKRKYTKGFYFASIPNKKSAPATNLSHKDEEINTHVSSISPAKPAGIPVNDKKTPIISSSISAQHIEQKATLATLPEATNLANIHKSTENIVSPPDGVPGHGAVVSADSSSYDGMATAAMIFGLAALLLLLGAIVFSSALFIEGSGDLYIVLMYLCALLATIFGFTGHKSERYRGRATAGKIIGLVILIGTFVLFIAIIAVFG
jgi:hypothetical protein